MGFRTLEISRAAEIHIKEGQLEITTEDGAIYVLIEDLNQIMMHGANIQLTKKRREWAHVLHNACIIDGVKVNVMSAIEIMVESLKRIILDAILNPTEKWEQKQSIQGFECFYKNIYGLHRKYLCV